jgi:hypothetical protein
MYSLTLQGMKRLLTLTPMSTMTLTWILRQLPTIVSSGLMLIVMYAVQMQTLMQILVQVTMHGPRKISATPRDYNALHPQFPLLPTDIIKKTFEVRKCFKSPNPAVNVR